jgi:hypothetical protein
MPLHRFEQRLRGKRYPMRPVRNTDGSGFLEVACPLLSDRSEGSTSRYRSRPLTAGLGSVAHGRRCRGLRGTDVPDAQLRPRGYRPSGDGPARQVWPADGSPPESR